MGMYTVLVLDVDLREDTPADVLSLIGKMCNLTASQEQEASLPSHPLFKCHRWPSMLRMESHYFDEPTDSKLEGHRLHVSCNLKNYEKEIQKFLDWIQPYVVPSDKESDGYYRYEENEEPTYIKL